MTYGCKIQN